MSPCCWRMGQGRDRAPFPVDGHGLSGRHPVLVHDRRIFAAGRRLEAVAEARPDHLRGGLAEVHVDAAALADEQRPEVVDAVAMVGVLVGHQHAVEPIDVGVEELLAEVRRGVDQHPGEAASGRCARPAARSAAGGSSGCSGSQAPQPSAGRGTPMDDPQPRMVKRRRHAATAAGRGTLLNSRKKFSVVWRAISSGGTPRVSASTWAVSAT